MCGRTACTLNPTQLQCACRYQSSQKEMSDPVWKENPSGTSYVPSFNMAPSDYSPVIIAGSHFEKSFEETRVIMPMRWGLIPRWHKGEPMEFQYKMINCRSDHLLEKSSFKHPLSEGKRCVVLADGFYEWKSDAKLKQPYFVYFHQNECVKWADPSEESEMYESWTGRKPLTIAGIFDISQSGALYSYVIITVDTTPELAFMHDRIPAILESDAEIAKWINPETPTNEAIKLLRPVKSLMYHKVGSGVNNVRNKLSNCIQPLIDSPKKRSPEKSEQSPKGKKAIKLDPSQTSMLAFVKKELK